MSLTIAAILISVVWLIGFGLYMMLSRQHHMIEQEIDDLQQLLDNKES